jgi:hypothetical protein
MGQGDAMTGLGLACGPCGTELNWLTKLIG